MDKIEATQADRDKAKISVADMWDYDFTTAEQHEEWLSQILARHRQEAEQRIIEWLRKAAKENWLAGPYDAALTAEALSDAARAIASGIHRESEE